jgi:hypothetical protein
VAVTTRKLRPVHRATPLAREATFAAGAAGVLAALLAWLGPPGSDLAAHAYQRAIFLQHGFSLWNNFWYAGRYSFITYSVLYYPLAGLLGIRLLAVATIATAALAFAVVIGREWGPTARWSSRTFAVVWAGVVLSAAFPFALGIALALLALWAIQAHRHGRFALLAALTLAASPLAFLLLALLLGGIALGRRTAPARLLVPAAVIGAAGAVELLLWRAFPDNGRYPFSLKELAAASTFCALGAALTWGVERARVLSFVFVVYWAACLTVYLVPSAVGENIARVRYAAIPVAVLALSLRAWRPRIVCLAAFALAAVWNVSPLATNYARASADPAHSAAYWSEVVSYLHRHLSPSYRVEAVDTTGHWAAVYLPRAGIPLARGWFRQDDFPQNRILYSPLGPRVYQSWLRRLGVRYVVVTSGQPDYSSRGEAALLASGRSGLIPVLYSPNATIYRVPRPRALVSGPARVLSLSQTRLSLVLSRGGTYRIAFRFSPYWHPSAGCVFKRPDGMMSLVAPRGGLVTLQFDVGVEGALREMRGHRSISCADVF